MVISDHEGNHPHSHQSRHNHQLRKINLQLREQGVLCVKKSYKHIVLQTYQKQYQNMAAIYIHFYRLHRHAELNSALHSFEY